MRYFYYNPITQYENMGDLLINKSLLDLLRPYGTIIIDDLNKPKWFIDKLKRQQDIIVSERCPNWTGKYLEDHLLKNRHPDDECYQIFVPGDKSRKGFKKALSSLDHFYKLVRQKKGGCKSIRLGFSLGDFDAANLITESFYSSAFYAYGIRDSLSMRRARTFRFRNTFYFPDLAWAYQESNHSASNPFNEGGKYIVLSFRANKVRTAHEPAYLVPVIAKLKTLLKTTLFDGAKIVISYQVAFDRDACMQLRDALQNDLNVYFLDKLLSIEEAVSLYRGAELTISNRLHVLLLAAVSEGLAIPFVNAGHNKKITGIYRDNDLFDIVIDYTENDTTMLEKIQDSVAAKETILKRLATKKSENITHIKDTLNAILSN